MWVVKCESWAIECKRLCGVRVGLRGRWGSLGLVRGEGERGRMVVVGVVVVVVVVVVVRAWSADICWWVWWGGGRSLKRKYVVSFRQEV